MRVGARRAILQADLAQELRHPAGSGLFAAGEGNLTADAHGRVECRHRALEDEPEEIAAQGAYPVVVEREHGAPVHREIATGTVCIGRKETADGEPQSRFARAGFAHQAERAAGRQVEARAVQRAHGPARRLVVDDEIVGPNERAHVRRRPSIGSRASRNPSPTRFTDRMARARTMPAGNTSQGAMLM